ncbi:hypothetical protein HDV05_000615 [Chytridiales sp. JEL 0842]|nr:hypothetical protein HDV05_000615 [Chytridiales sp. JEL 0842]
MADLHHLPSHPSNTTVTDTVPPSPTAHKDSSSKPYNDNFHSHLSADTTSSKDEKRPPLWKRLIPMPREDLKVIWSRRTLVLVLIEAVVLIALEAYLMFAQNDLYYDLKRTRDFYESQNIPGVTSVNELIMNFRAGAIYRSAFIASVVFGVYVSWDALLTQNLIEVISIIFYSIGQLVFTVIQIDQTNATFRTLSFTAPDGASNDVSRYPAYKASEITLVVVTAAWLIIYTFLAYKLKLEFGWTLYRLTGGDKALDRAFTSYHILLLLLKFSIFFLVLFSVILLGLSNPSRTSELVTPIVGVPTTAAYALLGYLGLRREKKPMIFVFFAMSAVLAAYVGFRLFRAFDPMLEGDYRAIRRPLSLYGALVLVLLMGCCVYAVVCMRNFGVGLKSVLDQRAKWRGKKDDGGEEGEQEDRGVDL